MNSIITYVPAVLFASMCVAGCSSADASPMDSASSAAETNASVAASTPAPRAGVEATSPNAATPSLAPPTPDVGDAGAGYFSCSADDDCVAVPYIERCCYNGWKIAVASSASAAFTASEECSFEQHTICPQYMVDDTRVATCNVATRSCEMVEQDAGAPVSPTIER